jgi:hypothetical protein
VSSHGSIAAKVRADKEANPSRYCATDPRCLWRIKDRNGNPTPCMKHPCRVPETELTTDDTLLEDLQRSVAALNEGGKC